MKFLNNLPLKPTTTIDDLIGIGHCKLGFYKELRQKLAELEQSNRELEDKRKELQVVLDGITDLMLVITENYHIQQTNHIATTWFNGQEVVGKKCYQLLRQSTTPCENCPVSKADSEQRVIKEHLSYSQHGEIRHFELIASPMPIGEDGLNRVLLFKRDITLEKKYQVKYAQSEKMATVGALAAGIAHEINNPLTSISGFAQGLQRRTAKLAGKVDDELLHDFEEYSETIIAECLRCRDIVKTLLSFSRPQESTRSIVRLNQCVGDTLFILQHHLRDHHNIQVHTQLDPTLPPILGDEAQLKQVIINLVINAFDALPEGGEITITSQRAENGHVELIVKDSGKGIDEETSKKIFDPFFSTKKVGKGTGIGLSTCYSIVTNHQGSITLSHNTPHGAIFTVSLPEVQL